MNNGKLTIAKIEAENFLMITKIDYTPRQGMNVFAGTNSQGKTDIIRLLKSVFKGCGAEVIQHGKDKTSIMVRLNDGSEIKRSITEKSKRFQVKTAEGDYKASPQAYLDNLLGDSDLSFDPIAFVLKDSKDQKQMLLESFNIGKIEPSMLSELLEQEDLKQLDFNKDGLAVLKDAETIIYTKRGESNKEIVKKKALYEETLSKIPDFDPETYKGDINILENVEVQIKEKEKELNEALITKRQVEGTQKLVNELQRKIQIAETELKDIDEIEISQIPVYEVQIKDIEQKIHDLQAQLAGTQSLLIRAGKLAERKERLMKEIKGNRDTIKELPSLKDIPDIPAIEKVLTDAKAELEENNKENEKFAIYQEAQHIKAEYDSFKKQSDRLTRTLDVLRKDLPDEIMKNQNIPFESLTFEGDEVIINGNRLSLMATSEMLFATLLIYKERNKNAKLKIVCADRIESLDDESYKKFWEFCQENGYQAFVTKVISAQLPEDAVMMEGGEIK